MYLQKGTYSVIAYYVNVNLPLAVGGIRAQMTFLDNYFKFCIEAFSMLKPLRAFNVSPVMYVSMSPRHGIT